MRPYELQLKKAAAKIIETLSSNYTLEEKTDLGIITFNTAEQIAIKIEMQELFNLGLV